MFKKIRYRLLFFDLLVFALVLSGFAIAVRVVFVHNLKQQLTNRLITLGQSAAANAEIDDGRLKVEDRFLVQELLKQAQTLEWFDRQGRLIMRQGENIPLRPLNPDGTVEIRTEDPSLQSVTLPIVSGETSEPIGYVRVSQELDEFNETIFQLDIGLGSGVGVAIVLSSIGSIWLNRQVMRPIEASFERLRQFTADASHELRSPLMAISSNVEVALKYAEGMRPEDHEVMQAIASATAQMTALTEDLLMLARTDQTPNIKQDIVDLRTILENLFQLYTPHADAKQIRLELKLSDRLEVRGDAVQLTRFLTNLIDNALRYTQEKGTVTIEGIRERNVVLIHVRDTGIGIDSEQLKHIFDRFWRADQARSYSSGGFGLGLAIAQGIAQRHGGSITVSSQLGVGSCFTVRLPAIG